MTKEDKSPDSRESSYRTQLLGMLSEKNVGQTHRICGWVHKKRDHGGLLFVDMRDASGLLQCVVQEGAPGFSELEQASFESVLQITGKVALRTPDTVNADLTTGKIELCVAHVNVLSAADPLPLQVNSEVPFPEETRLKNRFLDLRRPVMQKKLRLRAAIIQKLRALMSEQGFLEVQTPILTASSPEGARDYLVPSRVHKGCFYALPQAPQQFKQLLMAGGVDRYFQIAPCFRDEDARKDRSPGEFYQLDFEMAFATQEDVFAAIEPVMHNVFTTFSQGRTVTPAPFPRIPYDKAMLYYGCDKPDLRNPLVITDVTDVFKESAFDLFRSAIAERGCVVRAISVPPLKEGAVATRSRKFFDELTAWMRNQGAGGMAYILQQADGLKGPLAKFFDPALQERLQTCVRDAYNACAAYHGDCSAFEANKIFGEGSGMFFVCEPPSEANTLAGALRVHLGQALDCIERHTFRFCWVVDFPMYEKDTETGQVAFSHNPFSMPQGGLEALQKQDPLSIKAWQYDIVVNGIELSSGAIRNHLPDVMVKAFEIAGYSRSDVQQRFGALFDAFHYGVPPHGGAAPGVDRIVMLLADEENLREVTAFPLNQRAQDVLMNAPAPASEAHLKELGLHVSSTISAARDI